MNNLVPVQRRDRNGKLVTRHVKADAGMPSSMMSVPAPKLGQVASGDSIIDGIRTYPSQGKSKARSASGMEAAYGETPAFEASDIEMYSVLSVTTPSTALELLAAGVKSGDEAEEWLFTEGRVGELENHAEEARQMLSRRVAAQFYLMGIERLTDEQVATAKPELLHDYLEFFAIRSIMRKDSPAVADEVLSGEIRLSDVRDVGIDNLKTGNRLEIARPAFKALKQGTDKFSIEDLRHALLQFGSYNNVAAHVGYLLKFGSDSLARLNNLGAGSIGGMNLGDLADRTGASDEDTLDVIDYTSRLVEASGLKVKPRSWGDIADLLEKGKLLHDSGVDVQYAAERIHDEEPQVIVATFNGTPKAVSSGWL